MRDKLLFDILQTEIDSLQEQRKYSSMKYTTDKEPCLKIEVLEDLRTKLVSKGFFSETIGQDRESYND